MNEKQIRAKLKELEGIKKELGITPEEMQADAENACECMFERLSAVVTQTSGMAWTPEELAEAYGQMEVVAIGTLAGVAAVMRREPKGMNAIRNAEAAIGRLEWIYAKKAEWIYAKKAGVR